MFYSIFLSQATPGSSASKRIQDNAAFSFGLPTMYYKTNTHWQYYKDGGFRVCGNDTSALKESSGECFVSRTTVFFLCVCVCVYIYIYIYIYINVWDSK